MGNPDSLFDTFLLVSHVELRSQILNSRIGETLRKPNGAGHVDRGGKILDPLTIVKFLNIIQSVIVSLGNPIALIVKGAEFLAPDFHRSPSGIEQLAVTLELRIIV